MMTSKERVRRAFERKPVDRVPIFMGGVDTQGVLPHGAAGQVRAAAAELLEGMTADGGGYILAASHTVPPGTPDENNFAMYDEAGITKGEIFDRAAQVRASRRH